MTDILIQTENTPNPNALKFILNKTIKTQGSASFKSEQETENMPLAKALFLASDNIKELYFLDNSITVTQDGNANWDDLKTNLEGIIKENLINHDPDFFQEGTEDQGEIKDENPELTKINQIINEQIRPALQMHGGDVQVLRLLDKKLIISYQGACGSCPSAALGTLQAITNVLQEQYDPEIKVQLA